MTVLSKIAFFQNRRDEVPNQELARSLAGTNDTEGIREIANHLFDKNKNISSDCLKVLYEIGYISPELIAEYCEDFLKLLNSKQNRMVWGATITLSTIAKLKAETIFGSRNMLIKAMNGGSVITMDNGIKILALVASQSDQYLVEIFPYLLEHLRTCRLKEVPQHAESIMVCVNSSIKQSFMTALEQRLPEMAPSQASRIKKIFRSLN